AVLMLGQWIVLHSLEKKAAVADANVSHWTDRTRELEREWNEDQAMMREPQNAATLTTSEFLNNLFAEKAFSWTAALMDMENVLPGGVQVVSMQPQMTKDGHVLLRLQVTGERDKAVELVKNLETSKHFLDPKIAGESAAQASTGNGRPGFAPQPSASEDVNFDILAEYNAQGMEVAPTEKTKATEAKASDSNAAGFQATAAAAPAVVPSTQVSHPVQRQVPWQPRMGVSRPNPMRMGNNFGGRGAGVQGSNNGRGGQ
ncbi:MAG TPA: hypothetical protein VMU62_01570, partial [Acidobacteriaceae bacterium]|nr:hypothetical protein [Acidobacteriaceae bacterium]